MVVALAAIETSDLSDLLPAAVEPRNAWAADQPWLTPQERNHAGFADTLLFSPAKPLVVATRWLRIVRRRRLAKRHATELAQLPATALKSIYLKRCCWAC